MHTQTHTLSTIKYRLSYIVLMVTNAIGLTCSHWHHRVIAGVVLHLTHFCCFFFGLPSMQRVWEMKRGFGGLKESHEMKWIDCESLQKTKIFGSRSGRSENDLLDTIVLRS